MIELTGLAKSFRGRRAIDDVTLRIPSGTVTCVLGLNGAGKTTLLRLIAGLDDPDRGSVLVCGRRLREQIDPMRLLGVHLGPDRLDPRRTAVQHLRWLAAMGGIETKRIDEVLAEVGMSSHRTARISSLSLGARQRLAIAGALLGDPAATLFDEPLNGLDVPGIVWFRRLLRRLGDSGNTVVVATHLLGEVALTADRLVVLDGGTVVAAGPVDESVPAGVDVREHLENRLMALHGDAAYVGALR